MMRDEPHKCAFSPAIGSHSDDSNGMKNPSTVIRQPDTLFRNRLLYSLEARFNTLPAETAYCTLHRCVPIRLSPLETVVRDVQLIEPDRYSVQYGRRDARYIESIRGNGLLCTLHSVEYMDVDRFESEESSGEIVNSGGDLAFKPNPLPPEVRLEGELLDVFAEATTNVGQLSGVGRRVENPSMLISPFIYKEAVVSSEIEGTRVTLSEVYEYEAGREGSSSGASRNELREVHNYVDAVFQGIDELEDGIDLELVQTLHNTLMSGVRGGEKKPGEFRDTQVYLGSRGSDARFVPPPPSVVPYSMQNVETYIRTGGRYQPLLDIGLVHYQFETIHPFRDGNGRMGRLLIMLMMCKDELLPEPYLYPSSYFNRNRDEYTDRLLAVSRDSAWEEWLIFFLKGISQQAEEAFSRASELLDLRDEYRDRYQDSANSVSQLSAEIFTKPYLTVNEAEDLLDMTYRTANNAVKQLEEDRVLEEITGQRRNRVFRAREVFDIIQKPLDELRYQ